MNVGLDDAQRAQVASCYDAAVACSRVVRESYMGSNADEYWAEGVQAWFQASARADVNEGMLTRAQVRRHAECQSHVFADRILIDCAC